MIILSLTILTNNKYNLIYRGTMNRKSWDNG
ncbi:hypothetical protein HNR50_000169 [Spirochaeta isovalerica]|uniref:Uncharacterized protein n=1 Tax=Spirochaeta isovalerica TaxID=150 RepID=A0A841R3Y9_9SPIO|nr:hypothetical protein [Spirochaeta isovalerica]